jgi:5-methylcytosine-specific restriction protein A
MSQRRLYTAFRNLLVKASIFSRRVVAENLLLPVFRQGVISVNVGLIGRGNRRHAPLIERRLLSTGQTSFAGPIWQRDRLEFHFRRTRLPSRGRHWLVCGGVGIAHRCAPFHLKANWHTPQKFPPGALLMRTVDERIGQTDDTCAPPRVRARIVNRDHSCHLCGQPIQVDQNWDLDHVKALINGGEDRESNLRPSHRKCHVAKTALDVAERAKVSAVRKKHLGIAFPKRSIKSQGFANRSKPDCPSRQALPPAQLYAPIEETR